MTTQQTGPKVTVYLASRRDWDNWFLVTKSTAKALQIWKIFNPDLEAEPTFPNTPTKCVSRYGGGLIILIWWFSRDFRLCLKHQFR
jgi:hypothetical protein